MQLTQYTDYGLRILLYLGLKGQQATAQEISLNFRMSRNHVSKIIHDMAGRGWLETTKGKGGGVRLAPQASGLTIAAVVEALEPDFKLVECFDPKHNQCPIIGVCRLETLLHQAKAQFLNQLAATRISDLLRGTNAKDPRRERLNL